MADTGTDRTDGPVGYYPPAVPWDSALRDWPIWKWLEDAAEDLPDRPFLDFMDRRSTYGEVLEQVNRAAAGFRALGVGPGVRVGLYLPNTPHYVICFFAVLKAGGQVANFSPLYAERELVAQMRDSKVHMMVTLDVISLYPHLALAMRDAPLDKVIVGSLLDVLPTGKSILFRLLARSKVASVPKDDRHVRFADLVALAPPLMEGPEIDTGDLAVLQYTGGTTGVPKAAMLSHRNWSAAGHQAALWCSSMSAESEEKVVGVLPLYHCFALAIVLLCSIYYRSEIILHPRFELDQLLKDIDRKKATTFVGVPTLYNAMINHPDLGKYDLSSLRVSLSGGAPIAPEVREKFGELSGCRVIEGYGLSETAAVVACTPFEGEARPGSVGLPLPGITVEIRDLADHAQRLGPNEKGEICIRGPQVMAGYLDRPEATAETLPDGLLRTGDIGYLDDEGYLWLVDRIKEMIISGGYNVYPRIIEDAIFEHPDVTEAAVIGIPDEYRGESAKAYIVLTAGRELTLDELKTFLSSRIGPHEMPVEMEIRDELPKTPVGKISRKDLVTEDRAQREAKSD